MSLTSEAKRNIYTIWQQKQPPVGVKLTEDDYTSLALSIALKSDTTTQVLKQQEDRITNTDRKKRLEFLMPSYPLIHRYGTHFSTAWPNVKTGKKKLG